MFFITNPKPDKLQNDDVPTYWGRRFNLDPLGSHFKAGMLGSHDDQQVQAEVR